MKKLLLILLSLPLLLYMSCGKTECDCGDILDSGNAYGDIIEGEYINYLIVENECTFNVDTIIVTKEVYGYYVNRNRYCTDAW